MAREHTSPTADRSKTANSATRTTQNRGATSAVLQRLEQAPQTLRPADVLQLQRSIGNRATGQLLQAKLKLGPAGDQYEQEADQVAKQVVRASRQPDVQRADLDEDDLQAKSLAAGISQVQRDSRYAGVSYSRPEPRPTPQTFVAPQQKPQVQREEMDDELQASANHGLEGGDVDTDVARSIQSAKGGGQPLHDGVRSSMERGFGADFGGVRVHTGGQADALNRSLNARAFTTGKDIFFGKGQYNPGSTGGQELIAHELTHTVQQGAAGVQRDTVQRLISSGELSSPNKAGLPKEDKKIGIGKFSVTKKMSTKYKAVLAALDNYNHLAPGVVSPQENIRVGMADTLKGLLERVKEAVQVYYDEHHEENDQRVQHVAAVYAEAEMEKRAIDVILKKPVYQGMAWRLAIAPFMRVYELSKSGIFDTSLFHGTGSSLLDHFQGELMTGKELERRGIVRGTGEGDFFSRARSDKEVAGEKDFISVGLSLPGMGASLAYAKAAGTDKNYNTGVYTDEELQTELQQLDEIITNWDENLNQVPHDDIMAARKNRGQFLNLQQRLQSEVQLRQSLDPNHPRRRGEKYNESTYGVLIEFGNEDLEIENPRGRSLKDEKASPMALSGERSVKTPAVDLRIRGRLRRVYCPLEKIETVRERMAQIVNHNEFEVIPFEVLDKDFMDSSMEHTEQLTIDMMEMQYEKMRRMVLASYSKGMREKKPINGKMLTQVAHQLKL